MALALKFDYKNVMDSAVGNNGLSPADLDEAAARYAVIAFRERVKSGEVGFPDLPADQRTLAAVMEFARDLRKQIENVLVVGIGGSALGAFAVDGAMRGPHPMQTKPGARRGKPDKLPNLVILDNVDPGFLAAALDSLNPKRTAVVVIAKSGSTAETIATFLIVREWLVKGAGAKRARERTIAITDASKGDLLLVAKEERYPLFFIPGNVGGRYSVFTPVGLVPAALIGLDIRKMLRGAADANDVCWKEKIGDNPALTSAVVHHALATQKDKTIEVVFAYSQYLWGAAFWYRQLWAESLGKRVDRKGNVVEAGQTPIAALGVTDQHSQLQLYMEGPRDKMFTFWGVERHRVDLKIPKAFPQREAFGYLGGQAIGKLFDSERRATESALTQAGRPNCRWMLPCVDEYTIGAFFQALEFQTAYAGELWGINAFDQPGVELGKKLTYGMMGRKGY
jgi:glucose-6-phosphate isomerase